MHRARECGHPRPRLLSSIGPAQAEAERRCRRRISAKLLGEVLEGAHCEAIVLDVRDEADFDAQHIEGAELYPARRRACFSFLLRSGCDGAPWRAT